MKFGLFAKTALVLVLIYVGLKLIQPPLLSSLVQMYMLMATIYILIYVSANPDRLNEWLLPLKFLVFEERAKAARMVLMVLIPLFFSYLVYSKVTPELEPPATLRVIHPAPPRGN